MWKKYEKEEEEDIGIGDLILGGGDGGNSYKEKEEIKPDLNNKDYILEMINTQDLIEETKTKNIKEKYKQMYQLLKNKNINDNAIITILTIYFINKEHPELLDLIVIKKAKEFIKKSANISYENILKTINIY